MIASRLSVRSLKPIANIFSNCTCQYCNVLLAPPLPPTLDNSTYPQSRVVDVLQQRTVLIDIEDSLGFRLPERPPIATVHLEIQQDGAEKQHRHCRALRAKPLHFVHALLAKNKNPSTYFKSSRATPTQADE